MKQLSLFLLCATAGSLVAVMPPGFLSAQASRPDSCYVTTPNGIVAGSSERNERSYGNALLSVGPLGLWPNGTVVFKPGGAGFQTKEGALGMKFGWTRHIRGKINVSGRRIDADAPPLRFETNQTNDTHSTGGEQVKGESNKSYAMKAFGGRGRDRTGDPLLAKQVPCMATVSPSVSAKSHKRFFRCSKARSTPLCTAWKNEDGLPLSGASPKRVGRPSFTIYRRRAASNWRAKNRTGSGWQERWSTFCKPWNRNLSCPGGNPCFPSARPMSK